MNKIIITKIPKFIISNNIIKTYTNNDIAELQDDILSKFNTKNTVILVGQVQSGKTKRVIELMGAALYENKYDYDCIIYFTGDNTELNKQAVDRIGAELPNVIPSNELDYETNLRKLVIVSLKEDDNVRNVKNFVMTNKSELRKILIIDDESDYGSINTKNAEEYEKGNFSTVYKGIYDDIYKLCDSPGGVLKLTATPYVNILTEKDYFQEKEPYLFSLPTSEEYTGVKYFNNLGNDFWIPISNYHNLKSKSVEEYRSTIIEAYFIWVYKSYLLYKDNSVPRNNKSDLLINITNNKNDHEKIKEILEPFVYFRKSKDVVKDSLIKSLNKNIKHNITEDEYENILDFYFDIIKKSIDLIKFNGDNDANREFNFDYNVVVGGKLLSRGKTFDNLICELIVIDDEYQFNYDSMLQKCRWFGYRGLRAKYMSLICNNAIISNLKRQAEEIINIFHNNNLGYELDYKIVLRTLENWNRQSTKNKCTLPGKI